MAKRKGSAGDSQRAAAGPPRSRLPAPPPIFVGRQQEWETLERLTDEATLGRGSIALLAGEAGIGKSALLASALVSASERGMAVFYARAEELERTRPFGSIADALGCHPDADDPARARIGALVAGDPSGPGGDPPATTFRVVQAITDLVRSLAADRTVVIAVDDLQWADPATLQTLAAVRRRTDALPVLILGTLRPAPRSDDLAALLREIHESGGVELRLDALAEEPVADLVRRTLSAEPGSRLLDQIRRAAGNPLFVTELLKALEQERALVRVNGHAEVAEATLPPTLRLTIIRRLSVLPEDTLHMLRVASVVGSAFALNDLSTVTQRSVVDLVAILEPAFTTGVLGTRVGGRVGFRHDLIHEAVYGDIPADVRAALHHEAAGRLAAADAPATQVAEHFSRGAAIGDRAAVEWIHRAAREVATRVPSVAIGLLERALELTEPLAPERDSLQTELLVPLAWTGRQREAEELARDLLARASDPETEANLRRKLAETLSTRALWAEAADVLEPAKRLPGVSDWLRSSILAEHALTRPLAFSEAKVRDANEALELARRAGNQDAKAIAQRVLAEVLNDEYRFEEAESLLRHTVGETRGWVAESGRQERPLYSLGSALLDLANTLNAEDRFDEAEASFREISRIVADSGVAATFRPFVITAHVDILFATGRWDEALAEADSAQKRLGIAVSAENAVALIAALRGDVAGAQRILDAGIAMGIYRDLYERWVRAIIAEARGNLAASRDLLRDAWTIYNPSQQVLPDYVRVAIASGDPRLPNDILETIDERARRGGTPTLRGIALQVRGVVQDDLESLLAAVEELRTSPRVLVRANAFVDAAIGLAKANDEAGARPLFEEALGIYDQLGAKTPAARALGAMREAGLRRGVRGRRGRAETGWDSLTPAELDVVKLVAQGLRNADVAARLFISPRTVQAHLSHIFTKLGVRSRAELVAEAARRTG